VSDRVVHVGRDDLDIVSIAVEQDTRRGWPTLHLTTNEARSLAKKLLVLLDRDAEARLRAAGWTVGDDALDLLDAAIGDKARP
jgi:hypothetical protein